MARTQCSIARFRVPCCSSFGFVRATEIRFILRRECTRENFANPGRRPVMTAVEFSKETS